MKNIERPEVQENISSLIRCFQQGEAEEFYDKLIGLGMPNVYSERIDWFNSEYVEPHHWEQWELEALSHINKNLTTITKDSNACQFMNFPSMKEKEITVKAEKGKIIIE